jgi:hypothetical protein
MTIHIDQCGGLFYVYKNLKTKEQPFDYFCQGNTGWQWAWDGDELTIYESSKKEIGYIYFKRRIFKPSEFNFHFKIDGKTTIVEPRLIRNFKDWVFEFEIDGRQYKFSTHRHHAKSLFIDGKQVAAFDKDYFHFFQRDTYTIYADNDVNIIILICLATFDGISGTADNATVNIDLGNLLGSKPPEDGKWRPKKNAY